MRKDESGDKKTDFEKMLKHAKNVFRNKNPGLAKIQFKDGNQSSNFLSRLTG